MKSPHLLAGTLALLAGALWAHGQSSLGRPVPAEGDLRSAPSTPSSSSDCGNGCRPRPLLGNLVRRLFMPVHPAPGPTPPAEPQVPTREDVARMIADGGYSPAEITAAKIRMDDAQAVHRRAAVRYLGTVDCLYYPEAELGLLAALRADRSETVRHEAALAIGNGRGTTQRLLEALHLSAQGSDLDGNPGETSERVRAAARAALVRLMPAVTPVMAPTLPPTSVLSTMPLQDLWQPDPFWVQPTSYFIPAAMHDLATGPTSPVTSISPRERELAQTISASREFAPAPAPPAPVQERTILQFFGRLKNGFAWRFTTDATQGDPRLSGLAPLGSELALPATSTAAPPIPTDR